MSLKEERGDRREGLKMVGDQSSTLAVGDLQLYFHHTATKDVCLRSSFTCRSSLIGVEVEVEVEQGV
jgi:hypothetical protein